MPSGTLAWLPCQVKTVMVMVICAETRTRKNARSRPRGNYTTDGFWQDLLQQEQEGRSEETASAIEIPIRTINAQTLSNFPRVPVSRLNHGRYRYSIIAAGDIH
jgi:hypothetical protein